ncbi:MAG TPA: methyltransferase domain-containing protein [Gemmataceae bacterium]|nr:methyltransferase domain-containing protein [Gemmataceae bacterium]
MWDPTQYLKYSDERSRPFFDLLARVRCNNPSLIVDLGCGPGNLTQTLTERWPAARVVGVDASDEMLAQAKDRAIPGRLDFMRGDITAWTPSQPIDLLVSNAAFQWVPGHGTLFPRLVGMLAPQGALAVQVPHHFEGPAHHIFEQVKTSSRWRGALQGVGLNHNSVMPAIWYVELLHGLGLTVDAWETTYIHVLTGENPVLEWFKGSALRPLLKALGPQAQLELLDEVGKLLKAAYPAKEGVTLLPFPRIFLIAKR